MKRNVRRRRALVAAALLLVLGLNSLSSLISRKIGGKAS